MTADPSANRLTPEYLSETPNTR